MAFTMRTNDYSNKRRNSYHVEFTERGTFLSNRDLALMAVLSDGTVMLYHAIKYVGREGRDEMLNFVRSYSHLNPRNIDDVARMAESGAIKKMVFMDGNRNVRFP